MATQDIKIKSFFQIAPTPTNRDKIVLCNQGFNLSDIRLITEPAMESKLVYKFFVYIGYSEEFKLEFVFERKSDCISCQRELTRAWAGVGEFSDEELQARESRVL